MEAEERGGLVRRACVARGLWFVWRGETTATLASSPDLGLVFVEYQI